MPSSFYASIRRMSIVVAAAVAASACGVGYSADEEVGAISAAACNPDYQQCSTDPCKLDPESCVVTPPPPPPSVTTTWHVANGGFESIDSVGFPVSWSRGGSSAQYVHTTAQAYSGSTALYMEGYWSYDAPAPFAVTNSSATPTVSAPYTLSLMAATNLNCNPCALISVQWMIGDSVTRYDNFSLPPNNNAWTSFSFTGTKPAQAERVRVRFEANDITHSGVRIDDVALRLN